MTDGAIISRNEHIPRDERLRMHFRRSCVLAFLVFSLTAGAYLPLWFAVINIPGDLLENDTLLWVSRFLTVGASVVDITVVTSAAFMLHQFGIHHDTWNGQMIRLFLALRVSNGTCFLLLRARVFGDADGTAISDACFGYGLSSVSFAGVWWYFFEAFADIKEWPEYSPFLWRLKQCCKMAAAAAIQCWRTRLSGICPQSFDGVPTTDEQEAAGVFTISDIIESKVAETKEEEAQCLSLQDLAADEPSSPREEYPIEHVQCSCVMCCRAGMSTGPVV